MNYVILGSPVALARPRFASSHKRVYDSQANMKLVHGIELSKQHGEAPLLSGPLHLDIKFIFAITRKKSQCCDKPYFCRPDLDNLIKYYADISTGIIYADDCIITSINASKVYGSEPKTIFSFKVIDG